MRISHCVLLAATLTLGACGIVRDSALNPTNWFGRSTSEPVAAGETAAVNPLIPQTSGLFSRRNAAAVLYPGVPVDEITELTIERVSGGAIVRVTGLGARQGVHDVQLTPADAEGIAVNGVLTYRLEGVMPQRATAPGGAASREVTAALRITDQDLRGVSTIRVEAQRNARSASR